MSSSCSAVGRTTDYCNNLRRCNELQIGAYVCLLTHTYFWVLHVAWLVQMKARALARKMRLREGAFVWADSNGRAACDVQLRSTTLVRPK